MCVYKLYILFDYCFLFQVISSKISWSYSLCAWAGLICSRQVHLYIWCSEWTMRLKIFWTFISSSVYSIWQLESQQLESENILGKCRLGPHLSKHLGRTWKVYVYPAVDTPESCVCCILLVNYVTNTSTCWKWTVILNERSYIVLMMFLMYFGLNSKDKVEEWRKRGFAFLLQCTKC